MRRRKSKGEETGPIAAHASLFSLYVYLLCVCQRVPRLSLTSPRLCLVARERCQKRVSLMENAELYATRQRTT